MPLKKKQHVREETKGSIRGPTHHGNDGYIPVITLQIIKQTVTT